MPAAVTTRQKSGWAVANTIAILYALFPLWWIVALSFKTPAALTNGSPIPSQWTFTNYRGIFQNNDFVRALINSIGIALIATFLAVVLGTMAAYAIARLRFPGKTVLIGVSLLVAMFPQISLVSPLFSLERGLHLFDTWPGLIIPYMTFALPLSIYTLSAFFREIPWDLEKAAKIDGATPYQAFRLVIVPVALAFFTGASQFEDPTGSITAAAVVITIPIILFVLFFQRRIVAGLTSGAVKG